MKVILLRDVAKIGRRFEVVEVPQGYAQNFLIPRSDAVPATAQNEKRVLERQRHQHAKQEANTTSLTEAITALSGTTQSLEVDANETGGLFKGVKEEDIADFLRTLGYTITAAEITIPQPLKHIGAHEITLGASTGKGSGVFTLQLIAKRA